MSCWGRKREKEEWEDYTCDICGKEVATKRGVILHKAALHSKPELPPKSFVCDYANCGQAFDNRQQLFGHKMSVHKYRAAGSTSKSGAARDFNLNRPPSK